VLLENISKVEDINGNTNEHPAIAREMGWLK
jgi:hypothetical protein